MEIKIPEPGDPAVASFFVFSLPKAGSSLLDSMMVDICTQAKLAYFAPTVELFLRGISEARPSFDVETLYRPTGYCFSGFRNFPLFLKPEQLTGRKALMLVRDPRDILVSLYYSTVRSHAAPGEGEHREAFLRSRAEAQDLSVDRFATMRLLSLEQQLDRYVRGLRSMDLRIYRYEDVIHRRLDWVRDILGFLGIDLPESALADIAARNDVWPDEERPDQHIRQVHPGDHRRKLRKETIDYLDANLSERWNAFGYPDTPLRPGLALSARIFHDLPDPYADTRAELRVVDAKRAADLQRNTLPKSERCKVYPPDGIEILGLSLLDEEDHPIFDLESETRFTLAFVVQVQRPIRGLAMGMRVIDAFGNGRIGRDTISLGLPSGDWIQGTLLEMRFELRAPRQPGNYLFECYCMRCDAPSEQFLARHFEGYTAAVRREKLPMPAGPR